MPKDTKEIAGARCNFCKRDVEEGGYFFKARVGDVSPTSRKKVQGGFICGDCVKRCAELLPSCPLNGVMRFKV